MDTFVGNDPKISLPPNEGLYLDVTVENLTLLGLIDTGSTCSIIHTKNVASNEIRENVLPTRCVLGMADGGSVGCKGTTILPLCIGCNLITSLLIISKFLLQKLSTFCARLRFFIRQAVFFGYLKRATTLPRPVNPVQTGE